MRRAAFAPLEPTGAGEPGPAARRLILTGRVQGVGFRPFVYRTAIRHGIRGWVRNVAGRVEVHAEAAPEPLRRFARALITEAPPSARPVLTTDEPAPRRGLGRFRIDRSASGNAADVHLPPDLSTCDDCLAEMRDPGSRRFRYPLTNCTQCGPRYTIIHTLPYDRAHTTMAAFDLCEACRREYEDPRDRRFHAEPLACPACGPTLRYAVPGGDGVRGGGVYGNERSLHAALGALEAGRILAVKGVGGYHLLCDATSPEAVARLRRRKGRPTKPLAVMFPMAGADGLDSVRAHAEVDAVAARALTSPERPIVLLPVEAETTLPAELAPGLSEVGAFLPYSPLHHLLSSELGRPVVATSANVSGEPVLTREDDVEQRLGDVADAFVHHDRAIVRPADDAVLRVVAGAARPVRLGRGLAPREIRLPARLRAPLLATGGHTKAAPAVAWGDRAVLAPHVGDLDRPRALDTWSQVVEDLERAHGVQASAVAHDVHPQYASTRWARGWARDRGGRLEPVQHHRAHASALALELGDAESDVGSGAAGSDRLAERGEDARFGIDAEPWCDPSPGWLRRNWLVFAWDAVGYGDDGTLWGGGALYGGPGRWTRVASFRPFRLPGGDRAARQPWRSAAALCWGAGRELPRSIGAAASDEAGLALARAAWERDRHCATTSAVGRLLDGAACLALGEREALTAVSYEGEAPMRLEAAAGVDRREGRGEDEGRLAIALPLERHEDGLLRTDWAPLVDHLVATADPRSKGLSDEPAHRARVVHATLVEAAVAQLGAVEKRMPVDAVGFTGGVAQNRMLAEGLSAAMERRGRRLILASIAPPNDGGLALGQVVEALAREQLEDAAGNAAPGAARANGPREDGSKEGS